MSRDPRIPPEYEGQVWPYRVSVRQPDGSMGECIVTSPFPPSSVGNPGEPVEAFFDFRNYHIERMAGQSHVEFKPESRTDEPSELELWGEA